MPHVIIKMHPGRDEETKQKLSQEVEQLIMDITGCSSDAVSVGIEDIPAEKWHEEVVQPDIIEKKDTIKKMPGYDI